MTTALQDRAIDVEEVSKLLGVHPRTVGNMVGRGDFPKPFRLGKSVRWQLSVVEQFISDRQAAANSIAS